MNPTQTTEDQNTHSMLWTFILVRSSVGFSPENNTERPVWVEHGGTEHVSGSANPLMLLEGALTQPKMQNALPPSHSLGAIRISQSRFLEDFEAVVPSLFDTILTNAVLVPAVLEPDSIQVRNPRYFGDSNRHVVILSSSQRFVETARLVKD